jgi:hypothetical protein
MVVKNPTEEMQLIAVRQNIDNIKNIKNPTDLVKQTALAKKS